MLSAVVPRLRLAKEQFFYRERKREILDALDQVNEMAGVPSGSKDRARQELRDSLKKLLKWARQTGRM